MIYPKTVLMDLALARRLLVEAGLRGSRAERRFDLGKLHAPRFQHDQQMVEQVGGLVNQVLAIVADGGKRGLHRLFAELLGAMLDALVEELARVGLLGDAVAR